MIPSQAVVDSLEPCNLDSATPRFIHPSIAERDLVLRALSSTVVVVFKLQSSYVAGMKRGQLPVTSTMDSWTFANYYY